MLQISKKPFFISLALVALLMLLGVSLAVAQGNGNSNGNGGNGNNNPNSPNTNTNGILQQNQSPMNTRNRADSHPCLFCINTQSLDIELSSETIAAMTRGLLDEYTAYAAYTSIIDQVGEQRPFVNLQNAEAMHIAAWERLFARYGLSLPEAPVLEFPRFANASEACTWAYEIEVNNVALYDELLISLADYPDMLQVVTSLRDASLNNHAVALSNCAAQ